MEACSSASGSPDKRCRAARTVRGRGTRLAADAVEQLHAFAPQAVRGVARIKANAHQHGEGALVRQQLLDVRGTRVAL
jgi:hypothetical protein